MKERFTILLLLVAFFVASPIEKLAACGNESDCCLAKTKTEKTEADSKTCCSHGGPCSENHPDQPCSPDGCGGHCGCHPVIQIGATLTAPVAATDSAEFFSDSLKKQAFYFAERQPEEVVLPIWQPPQLG